MKWWKKHRAQLIPEQWEETKNESEETHIQVLYLPPNDHVAVQVKQTLQWPCKGQAGWGARQSLIDMNILWIYHTSIEPLKVCQHTNTGPQEAHLPQVWTIRLLVNDKCSAPCGGLKHVRNSLRCPALVTPSFIMGLEQASAQHGNRFQRIAASDLKSIQLNSSKHRTVFRMVILKICELQITRVQCDYVDIG